MKKLTYILTIFVALFLINISDANAFSVKGEKVLSIGGSGYYELNSDWESLYFGFTYSGSTQTAGFGIITSFELGFTDRISAEIDFGYSRLVYSNRQRNLIKENYFTGDVVGHYYFGNSDTFNPYVIFGLGALISSGSVAPTGDVGFGMHFRLAKEFSIKTELIFKSAVILNRGEGRVGVAYHF